MAKLAQSTIDAIAEAVAAALVAAGSPAAAQASSPVGPTTFAKGTRDDAGNVEDGFPCTVAGEECSRKLRTAKRAAAHGIEKGHEAR